MSVQRYFIGFQLTGPAAEWHIATSRAIAEHFSTWRVDQHIPPHITIVRPFEISDIEPIKTFIQHTIGHLTPPGNITISGFNHFDDKVVFAKVDVDPIVHSFVKQFRAEIQPQIGVTKEDFPHWHPHATLAYKLPQDTIEQIWKHVQTFDTPSFVLPFNALTIFRYTQDHWAADETLRFRAD